MYVPKGESYLEGYTKDEIVEIYKREKEGKAKIRLLTAILRKEGKAPKEISDSTKYPLTTIKGWLHKMHKEGIGRYHSIPQPGRPKRLTEEQLREIDITLSEPPTKQGMPFKFWTTKLVTAFIKDKFGLEYKQMQVRRILRKLDFSCKKPGPFHKKAFKTRQEQFKKTSKVELPLTSREDGRSYIWTKASSR
jgi:transposase